MYSSHLFDIQLGLEFQTALQHAQCFLPRHLRCSFQVFIYVRRTERAEYIDYKGYFAGINVCSHARVEREQRRCFLGGEGRGGGRMRMKARTHSKVVDVRKGLCACSNLIYV